jgi:signal transduction histidine kinase
MLLSGLAVRDRDSADRTAAHVEQISSTVRQATDALDEIVWAINPQNDTLPHLVNYLGQFAVEFLRTANIRCRADLPDHPPHEPVPADVRHNLFLIMKESLNNIVRHAAATEVSLRVGVDDGSVTLIVEDNGRGFEEESLRDGANGLRNMRQRCGEIGGELQITSTPGKGTKVMLKVRRPRSDRATS